MPVWPSEHSDTVLYGEREFIADRDVALRMLDGTRFDIWGNVYINGELLSISTEPGVSNDTVSDAMLVNMPQNTVKGRISAGTGDPENLTVTQLTALLNLFSSTLKGLVPAPGTATGRYLKDDGTWATPVDTNTTYNPFTTTVDGLVPNPGTVTGKYLSDNGWSDPPNTPTTLFNSANWNIGLISHGAYSFTNMVCVGASIGDPVAIGISPFLGHGMIVNAQVQVVDAIMLTVLNMTGSNKTPGASVVKARVWKNEA